MALATYKDLCIDAVDTDRMGRFWAAALALEAQPAGNGLVRLVGPTEGHGGWVNPVPEPVTVKQRVHLDVRAASAGELEALGATVVDADSFPWTVMRDPEGGELCVFETSEKPRGFYELVIDSDRGHREIATWWGEVLGAKVIHGDEDSSLEEIPGFPYDCIVFGPVPEPKTVKNRIHFDVDTDDLQPLLAKGATVVRARDDVIGWTVLTDPDGNEFCAFLGES